MDEMLGGGLRDEEEDGQVDEGEARAEVGESVFVGDERQGERSLLGGVAGVLAAVQALPRDTTLDDLTEAHRDLSRQKRTAQRELQNARKRHKRAVGKAGGLDDETLLAIVAARAHAAAAKAEPKAKAKAKAKATGGEAVSKGKGAGKGESVGETGES